MSEQEKWGDGERRGFSTDQDPDVKCQWGFNDVIGIAVDLTDSDGRGRISIFTDKRKHGEVVFDDLTGISEDGGVFPTITLSSEYNLDECHS